MKLMRVLLLFLLPIYAYGLFGSKKNITVIGNLECGGSPYKAVTVELWDDDAFNFDDKLNLTHTDNAGKFKLYGEAREIRNIEPYLLIKHNCDNGRHDVRCTYTDRYNIPKSYQGMIYNLNKVDLKDATVRRKTKCY
uniref:Transthyretin-like family protein n=1 Tax=Elaeophora elaphi TaxID=1147741 RepID=A0A0R3RIV8_9BILA